MNRKFGRRASRTESHSPQAHAAIANGHAIHAGISERRTENGASTAKAAMAPISQRDGRSSNRQGADTVDKRMQFRIVRGAVTEEPAPEAVVLAGEQPFENGAFRRRRSVPCAVKVAPEQLVQLAHAAPASPAQALQVRRVSITDRGWGVAHAFYPVNNP